MPINRYFKLYLNAGRAIPLVINVNQYDSGETWYFRLFKETGEAYLPSSGAIIGIKADGHVIDNAATVDGFGYVVVTETEQMTAAPGKAVFELSIDDNSHGTANFIVLVEPKPSEGGILSDSDLSLLQEAIDSTSPAAIAEGVSDWMDEHLTPTTPVVDDTLTVQGAAADAKKTGDEIADLKSALSAATQLVPSETGDVGQVLTKTPSGTEWSDAGNPTDTQVAEAVSDWLEDNIEPTSPIVDKTLTIAGAAADAKKTGDEIAEVKVALSAFDINNNFTVANVANAPSPLTIPTPYTGADENQLCHPKVLFLKNKFGGHYFWMAFTPYPYSTDAKENPCIVCSDDLINWNVPTGLTNPIVPKPSTGYNSDTHLVYREDLRRLECWWRRYEGDATTETILRKTTTDGVNWSEAEQLYQIGSAESGFANLLCPVAIYDYKAQKYRIWASDDSVIRYFESANGINWQYIATTNLTGWHFDIIETDLGYEAFIHDSITATTLSYSVSTDCVNWTAKTVILTATTNNGWDGGYLYRSSAIKNNGIYYLFYTGVTSASSYAQRIWRLGLSISQEANNINSLKGYVSGIASVNSYLANGDSEEVEALKNRVAELEEKVDTLEDAVFSAVSIEVTPTSASVGEGGTVQLSATKQPQTAMTEWVSASPENATVSESGLVTGIVAGTVSIKNRAIRNPSVYGECVVTVQPPSDLFEGISSHAGYINGNTGAVVDGSSTDIYFDAIDITGYLNSALLFRFADSANAQIKVAFYDTNNTLIGSVYTALNTAQRLEGIAATVPSNAATVRIGCSKDESSIMINLMSSYSIDFTNKMTGKYYDASDGTVKNDSPTSCVKVNKSASTTIFEGVVSGALFNSNDVFVGGIVYRYPTAVRIVDTSSAATIGINFRTAEQASVREYGLGRTVGTYPLSS